MVALPYIVTMFRLLQSYLSTLVELYLKAEGEGPRGRGGRELTVREVGRDNLFYNLL